MRNKTTVAVIISLITILAFATTCIAGASLAVNGKAINVTPDAKGIVSAKALFTAIGCKVVVDKKGVMTITKAKDVVVISIKGVTKNKKPIKVVVKAVKGDFMVPYSIATTLFGVKFTLAAAPVIKPVTKPVTKPADTKPADTKPAEPPVPGGLTGDKAEAYKLLIGAKYGGSGTSTFVASLTNIFIVGDAKMTVTSKSGSASAKTIINTKDVPMLAGGDGERESTKVPCIEIADGKDSDILSFLKGADGVLVSGNVITVKKAPPPDSIIKLLDSITSKVTWKAKNLDMSCKIVVSGNKVEAVNDILIKGIANGTNDMPATITGSVKF